jgi:hypothetical protein
MDDLPIPLSRVELYLAKACGMDVTVPEQPESRLEDFLAVIAGDTSIILPTPASLTELWLDFVCGGPLTDEMKLTGAYWIGAQKVDVRFFAVAGGMDGVELPEPQNRTEQYWARIAETLPVHGVLKYATGTNIVLTDVVRGIKSLENVYGDTTQQTYTGKNLFNYQNVNNLALSTTIVSNDNYRGYSMVAQAGRTYTISRAATTGNNRFRVAFTVVEPANGVTFYGEDGAEKGYKSYDNALSGAFTVPAGMNYIFVYLSNSGQTISEDLHIQIESGSTATPYEPYVGSTSSQLTPSPNPDYPQDIQVVTGTQTVTITGKNLFDGLFAQGTYFNSIATNRIITSQSPKLTAGQTYTLSFTGLPTNFRFAVNLSSNPIRAEEGGSLAYDSGWKTTTLSFTPQGDYYFAIVMSKLSGADIVPSEVASMKWQLEPGATATTYEPYQSSDYEINLGKNLFSGNYSQFDNTGGTGTSYAYFKLPTGSYYTLTLIAKNDIEVQSPQKYIGFTRTGGSTTSPIKWAWNGLSSASAGDKIVVNNLPINDIGMPYLSLYPKNEATLNWFMENFDIQLELGDTSTSFAPYFEPIELCKIGTYQDYIYKSGDDWYVHKESKKVVYNGSENWVTRTGKSHTFQISISTSVYGISNYFTNIASTSFGIKPGMYAGNSNALIISYPDMTDVTAFTTWLGTHNLVFYEILFNKPADTKITNTALISQLNAIDSATLPKPNAAITVTPSGTNLAGALKISYYGEEE